MPKAGQGCKRPGDRRFLCCLNTSGASGAFLSNSYRNKRSGIVLDALYGLGVLENGDGIAQGRKHTLYGSHPRHAAL